jgi:succinoglycan biosynthesis protein ExoO
MKGTILVLTRHTPLPWEDGAGAYLFDVLRFLHTQGFAIHVAWLAPHDHLRWQGVWALPADFARVVTLHTPAGWRFGRRQFYPSIYWLPFKARALHTAKRLLARVGLHVGRKNSPATTAQPLPGTAPAQPISTGWMATPSAAEQAYAAHLLAKLRPSAVITNYAWLTPLFAAATANLSFRRLCLHPDVAWKRAAHQASLDGQPPAITAPVESALLQAADTVISISASDLQDHRQLAPNTRLVLAPKAVALHPLPPATQPRLLFVGSGNNFNATGLAWFLAEVWPLVRAARPDAELDVCGTVARAVADRPDGVRFHGGVPDLDVYYRTAALVIVPLLQATGLNVKLVDAAARARAIVTTPATLDGAPFLRDAVATADNADDFAQITLRLLADPARREALATRSLAAVRERLAPEVCYADLAAALR